MTDVSGVTATPTKRAQIAEHGLLDSAGNTVDEFEQATGIRYVDLASKLTFDYQLTNPKTTNMLALFGARTLATNEASASRQKDGDSAEQIEAIKARFAYMDSTGEWVDRSREGGPRWDQPTLATAAVNVLVATKRIKANDDEAKGKAFAKFVESMAADPAKVAAIRQVEGVEAEYRKLRGTGATKSADDLMAMVG